MPSKISVFDFSLSSAFRIFLFLGVALTSLFMGGAKAEAGTTPTIENGGLWYYRQVIGTDYHTCNQTMYSDQTTPLSSGYIWVDRSYTTGSGQDISTISQWQQCLSSSVYTVYSSPVATFAASTNKDTYAPGETVTVSVAASSGDQSNTIGGFFSGGIINAINNSLLNPFCVLFCTSTPAVGVTATYGGFKAHCEETGACGNSPGQMFTAPSDPGTYTINLRGWWYKSEPNEPTHSFSSMTFTVASTSCTVDGIVYWNASGANVTGPCSQNVKKTVSNDGSLTVTNTATGYTGSAIFGCSGGSWTGPTSVSCTAVGACGTANGKTYLSDATGYSPDTQCSVGISTNTQFPPPGGTYAWLCNNSGSNSGMCQAWRSAAVSYFTLSVVKVGSGTVNSTLPNTNINCGTGANCMQSYASGTQVTLTAKPDSGSSFTGWSGACTNITGDCVVSMTQVRAVTATFTAAVVSSAPVVTVRFDTTTVNWGGYDYLHWSATNNPTSCKGEWNQSLQTPSGTDRAPSGTENIGPIYGNLAREISCTNAGGTGYGSDSVTVLYTLFVIKSPDATAGTVTSTSVPPATGINCGATCSISYLSGTPVTLSATAANGYVFTSWTGGCTGTETTCNVTMNGARTVTATFTASAANTLTVTKSGTGTGTVRSTDNPRTIDCGTDCSETYASPTPVTLTASATSGSSFAGWSGCNSTSGNSCTVTVSGAKTVTATFTPVVSSAPVVTVRFDTTTVNWGGYDYLHWSATNNPTSCKGTWDNSYQTPSGTDRAPSGTENIGPIYENLAREISCTNAGGTGYGSDSVTVSYILSVITAGTGTGKVTGSDITCTRPSADGDICSWSYSSGNVTLTATRDNGSNFTGWSGACSGTGTCIVSMTQARSVIATFTSAAVVTGVCNMSVANGCTTGELGSNVVQSNGDYHWYCDGTPNDDAHRSSLCWYTPPAAVYGVCGTAKNSCTHGTLGSNAAQTDGSFQWYCDGTPNDATHRSPLCWYTPPAVGSGLCGTAKKAYSSSALNYGSDTFCSTEWGNNPANPTFPATGSSSSWTCNNEDGTTGPTCTATRNAILAVLKNGTGSGTVTSDPTGINCGATCSASYASGTSVTLTATATPDSGSSFTSWTGCGEITSDNKCKVTMDAARSVTATFTVVASPTCSSTGPGTETTATSGTYYAYAYGVSSSVTAVKFAVWGDPGGQDDLHWYVPAELTVDNLGGGEWRASINLANHKLDNPEYGNFNVHIYMDAPSYVNTWCGTANFTRSTIVSYNTLSVATAGTGTGAVTGSGITCTRPSAGGDICSLDFASGTSVTLTATPNSGTFTGWSGDCSGTDPCTVKMDASKSVTATFTVVASSYALAVSRIGTGAGTGTVTSAPGGISCGVTCSANYTSGTNVTLTASITSGTFTRWAFTTGTNNNSCDTANTCVVTVNEVKNVTATFTAPVCPYVAPDCSTAVCPAVTTCGGVPIPVDCIPGRATNCDLIPWQISCPSPSCGTWKEVAP